MKYQKLMVALAIAAFLGTTPTGAQAQAPTPGRIANSPHDLSADFANDNDEICVYCHTPHGGDISTEGAPLWNRALPAGPFTLYDSSTIDGEVLTTAGPGGMSLACLSCHDGGQARDTVINAPGTDGFNPAGAPMDPLADSGLSGIFAIGDGSQDLTNDHPIAIVYGGYDPGGGQIDPDINSTDLATTTSGDWYVDLNSSGSREKTDIILYTRTALVTGGGGDAPFVECGSCHDPHSAATGETAGNEAGTNVSFMRVDNASSALCVACHIK